MTLWYLQDYAHISSKAKLYNINNLLLTVKFIIIIINMVQNVGTSPWLEDGGTPNSGLDGETLLRVPFKDLGI